MSHSQLKENTEEDFTIPPETFKEYHKGVIKLIHNEIKEEEAKLRRRLDFLENLGQIYQLANKTFQNSGQSKRRKLDKSTKGCKWKKEQQKKEGKRKEEKSITK